MAERNTGSLAARLRAVLDAIVSATDELIDASRINYDSERWHRTPGVIFVGWPDGEWGPLDDRQKQVQRRILELWRPWWEQVDLLASGEPVLARQHLANAAAAVVLWVERGQGDHSIPRTQHEAKQVFRTHVAPLYEFLNSLEPSAQPAIVVPDTNVVLRTADVTTYGDALNVSAYTVFFVPGVLAELDEQKTNHRNEAVREKARKFSKRLKGWIAQGNLAEGVRVQGDVYVQAEGREPDFASTLPWLDKDVTDDRILASVLELQRRFPTTRIVLLTGDPGMLVKAHKAHVPTGDVPEPEPSGGE